LPGNDLFETDAEVFRLIALNIKFPVFARGFAHIDRQLSFAGSMKPKIEIVAYDTAVDAHHAIARLKLELCGDRARRNAANFDTAASNLGYCWCDGKLVHEELRLEPDHIVSIALGGRTREYNKLTGRS
jgi:hypothetical protein